MSTFLAIFLVANINYTLLSNGQFPQNTPYSIANQVSVSNNELKEKSFKSPAGTLLIALIPGFFIHGLGHFYIGEKKTGGILLAIEVSGWFVLSSYSIYLGVRGFFECFLGGDPNCLESEGLQNTGTVIGTIFVASFLGSWLYDVIAAPMKAMKAKRKYLERGTGKNLIPELELRPSMNFSGCTLALNWRF